MNQNRELYEEMVAGIRVALQNIGASISRHEIKAAAAGSDEEMNALLDELRRVHSTYLKTAEIFLAEATNFNDGRVLLKSMLSKGWTPQLIATKTCIPLKRVSAQFDSGRLSPAFIKAIEHHFPINVAEILKPYHDHKSSTSGSSDVNKDAPESNQFDISHFPNHPWWEKKK